MAKRIEEGVDMRPIRFFKGDLERLQQFYPNIGYNHVVRTLVRKHLKALEERLAEKIPLGELQNGQ